jgi:general secretion pathway protein H
MLRTSRARRIEATAGSENDRRRGIVLLDLVLAMAVMAFVALLLIPALPMGTSPARQGAYALEVAALLKTDRTAAARSGREMATQVNVGARTIVSGSTNESLELPDDLTLDVIASDTCAATDGRFNIAFAPDGRSCGAVIRVGKGSRDWRIRINWLTGYIDVVAPHTG